MKFFKRAIISISRRPGKSIILFLLVFILGSIISGALATSNAIINTDANLRRNMRPMVTFEADWEAFNQEFDAMTTMLEAIPTEIIHEIGNLPYVSHFNYSYQTSVGSFQLEEYQVPDLGDEPSTGWLRLGLIGSSNPELMDVTEGTIDLVEGRMFTDSEINEGAQVTVISKGFAEANQLTVGSILNVSQTIFNQVDDTWTPPSEDAIFATEDYQLEVIGVFDINTKDINALSDFDAHQERNRVQIMSHRIYVPNLLAKESQSFRSEQEHLMMVENDLSPMWLSNEQVNALFVLEDPFDLDAFRAAAEPLLPDFWTLIDMTDTFGAISSSMEIIQDIADWILWMALSGTLIVLNLLIMLFLRDRRYEMGVYLALGEKKMRILMQIVLEVTMTSIIGIILAVFVGNIISANMSQSMLRAELMSEEVNMGAAMFFDPNDLAFRWNGMAVEKLTPEEMLNAFDVSLDLQTTFAFLGIGMFVIVISTFLPVMYVMRMHPKKVLMEKRS